MDFEEVTEAMIGCAYRVHDQMGYGFLESVYERCMLVELGKRNLRAEAQKTIEVYYEGVEVGKFTPNLIVEDRVVVELKSVRKILKAHEVQLVDYLVATRMPLGHLLNFSERGVEVRRRVRQLKQGVNV